MDKKTLAICKKYAKELSEASGGNSFQLVVNGEGNAVVQIEKTETQLIVTKGTLDIEEKPEIWLGTKAELEALTEEEKESYVLFITTDEDGEIIDFNVEETGTGNVISSIVVENNVLKVNKITALTEHPATDIKPTTIGSETLGFGDTKEVVTDIKTDEFGHVTERSSCNITFPTETELSIEVTGEGNTVDNVSVEGHKITVNKVNRTEQNVNVTETGTGKFVTGVMATGHDVTVVRGDVHLDGKVKTNAEADSKYISEIVDDDSIKLENGYLVAKKLQGLNVGVDELNFIQGLNYSLVDKLNTLTNPLNFLGVYNTKAELEAVADVVNGNVAIVVQDENNDNKQMTYIYSNAWEAVSENTIELRNFTTEPIDLELETTGILPIDKVDTSTLAKMVDIAGFLTEETPVTINVSGTGSYITGITASDHTVTVTKGDVALSLTESGTGNGVANVEVNGTEVTVTKGSFLKAETPLKTEVTGTGNVITDVRNEDHKVIAEKNIKALEQRTDMSTGTDGEFVQYIGETTDDYTKGRFYQRVDSAWQEVSMVDAEVPVEDQKDYAEQVTEMPTPSAELLDKFVQYVGVTTEDYQNGLFYKCVQLDETTFVWEATNLVKVNTVASNFQFEAFPTASAEYEGKCFQYIGKTNANWMKGQFYSVYNSKGKYYWRKTNQFGINGLGEGEIFNYGGNTATGEYSHAEGYGTLSKEKNSHAEGGYTKANGMCSHAEGNSTTATGANSHAEGGYTKANGMCSHAEGDSTTASGDYSHAEGSSSQALGENSHAEGDSTTATGTNSHSEGESTTTNGKSSHAEGIGTHASKDGSHSENIYSEANGKGSHAEGFHSVANGDYSHVEGSYTIASSSCQHVFGKHNIEDSSDKFVEIVGNGNSTRSNARTLDWNGNEILSGTSTATDFIYSDGNKPLKTVSITTSGTGNAITDISKEVADGKLTLTLTKGTVTSSSTSISINNPTGTGNAITGLSANGKTITPIKGTTFALEEHSHNNYLTNEEAEKFAPILVTKTVEEGNSVWDIVHNKGTTLGENYGYPLVMVINQSTGAEEKFDIIYTSMDSIQIKGIDSLEIGTQYNIILR